MILLRVLTCWLGVALTGCASGPIMSPYFQPEGTDLFYSYGQFCGPGVPDLTGVPETRRVEALNQRTPVDHIDLACRNHDLCFEAFGDDYAPCDLEFATVLDGEFRDDDQHYQCYNLALEITSAFRLKWRSTGGGEAFARRLFYPLDVAGAAVREPFAQALKAVEGFPETPGRCFFANPEATFAAGREALERGRVTVRVNGREVY